MEVFERFISKFSIEDNEGDLLMLWEFKQKLIQKVFDKFIKTVEALREDGGREFIKNLNNNIPLDEFIIIEDELNEYYEANKDRLINFHSSFKSFVSQIKIQNDKLCSAMHSILIRELRLKQLFEDIANYLWALNILYDNIELSSQLPLNVIMRLDISSSIIIQAATVMVCKIIRTGLHSDKEQLRFDKIRQQKRKGQTRVIIINQYKKINY